MVVKLSAVINIVSKVKSGGFGFVPSFDAFYVFEVPFYFLAG